MRQYHGPVTRAYGYKVRLVQSRNGFDEGSQVTSLRRRGRVRPLRTGRGLEDLRAADRAPEPIGAARRSQSRRKAQDAHPFAVVRGGHRETVLPRWIGRLSGRGHLQTIGATDATARPGGRLCPGEPAYNPALRHVAFLRSFLRTTGSQGQDLNLSGQFCHRLRSAAPWEDGDRQGRASGARSSSGCPGSRAVPGTH